jgi:phosphate transport system substrate-binding protein
MRKLLLLSLILVLTSCGKGGGGGGDLTGAGATFPNPLYTKWIAAYGKVDGAVTINYQSIGSGAGVKQLLARTVDFGASDVPMTDEELGQAPGKIIHLPTTMGAVVLAYNVPDLKDRLKLTPELVAGIYLGDITTWNDPKLAAVNPGVQLPAQNISVVYRADGSGTTGVFTGYLSAVSPAWKDKIGAGKSVAFPTGAGAKGNDGVAGVVKTTPGAIGYIELAYATAKGNEIPFALLQNAAGKFVEASTDSVSAAAAGAVEKMPDDLRTSILNAPGDNAYPISSLTYLLVYADMQDADKAKALAKFIWWGLHDGQALAAPNGYAPLPPALVAKEEAKLKALTAGGQPVLPKS